MLCTRVYGYGACVGADPCRFTVNLHGSAPRTYPFPTPVIVQCLRSDSSCFGHYNRSYLLAYLLYLLTC